MAYKQHKHKRRAPYSTTHMIQPRLHKPKRDNKNQASTSPPRNRISSHMHAQCGPGGEMCAYTEASDTFYMCVHAHKDVISDRIRDRGMWDDCEDIVWLVWSHFGKRLSPSEKRKKKPRHESWASHMAVAGSDVVAGNLEADMAIGHSVLSGGSSADSAYERIQAQLVVVDVGANIGMCTCALYPCVGYICVCVRTHMRACIHVRWIYVTHVSRYWCVHVFRRVYVSIYIYIYIYIYRTQTCTHIHIQTHARYLPSHTDAYRHLSKDFHVRDMLYSPVATLV